MNKSEARKIAGTITNEQIAQMLKKAKEEITDWSAGSTVNQSLSLGAAWNILAKDFDPSKELHFLHKMNLVREFGRYLPKDIDKPEKKRRRKRIPSVHQEPIFKSHRR